MIIAFFGHSSITDSNTLKALLNETIRGVICTNEKVSFYLGGYGDFDKLSAQVCRSVKKDFPNTETVFISPYFSASYQKKIKEMEQIGLYDASIYPPLESVPPRVAIVKRNEWIANNADLIIAYVTHSHGGAYQAIKYAEKIGKRIINLALKLDAK